MHEDPTGLPEADLALSQGRTDEAAELLLTAYVADPHDWHYLRRYCELTGRPYREPDDRSHAVPAGSLDPLGRLELYATLAELVLPDDDDDDDDDDDGAADRDEAVPAGDDEGSPVGDIACDHTFLNTLRWAEAAETDAIELFQLLNDFGAFCDCEVALEAWPRDVAALRVVVAGWYEGARRSLPIEFERDPQAKDPVFPTQVVSGVDLLDGTSDASESFAGDDRLVFLVRFPDVEEPPVVLLARAGGDLTVYPAAHRFDSPHLTEADHKRLDRAQAQVMKYKVPPAEFTEVPDDDTKEQIVDALAELIAAQGAEPFLRPPLLEAPRTERGLSDADRVRALMRALLDHAGLADVAMHIRLRPYAEALEDGSVRFPMGEGHGSDDGALGWFEGLADGRAVFGVDLSRHAELEGLLGTLGHEVSHAWRAYHGLTTGDRMQEEILTDLTTHYLGFGVFTTASSSRYRTAGWTEGQWSYLTWEHRWSGYLPAREMCYALAVQAVARGVTAGEVRRIASRLEPNQRLYFRAAVDELWEAADLGRALGIGRRRRRRGPERRRRPLHATVDERDSIEIGDHAEDEGEAWDGASADGEPGEPAFAMATHRTSPVTALCMLLALPFGLLIARATGDQAIGIIAALVLGALVWWKGPGTQAHACTICGEIVPDEAKDCPGCAQPIRGRVADGYAWLEAKERYEAGLDPDDRDGG